MAKKPLRFSTPYSDRTPGQVQVAYESLSLGQRLKLRFFGHVLIGIQTHSGWTGSLPLYLVYCHGHGIGETHPQGYENHIVCPSCRLVIPTY